MKSIVAVYFCASSRDAKNLRRKLIRRKANSKMIVQSGSEVYIYEQHLADRILPVIFKKA